MATDETGAVYIVTDHRLLALVADRSGMPQVRWVAPYDRARGRSRGSSRRDRVRRRTLIGKDLVAITDNAERG